uniref:Uncharacterized protein n=1 Tax=Arundo donax TaxID=35708 RepID=A0A0A8Z3U7_ARUDO
MQETKTITAV